MFLFTMGARLASLWRKSMEKQWKCRITVVEPSGKERNPTVAEMGDHIILSIGSTEIPIEVTPGGLVEYNGVPFTKNVPLEVDGFTIRPEAFIDAPPPRKKTGKVCRYCAHWSAKAGRKAYLEVVRLESGAQCELTQAITDQVARDYKLPPIDPDDVGICGIEDGLNAGDTPSCKDYKGVSIVVRARRFQKHVLQTNLLGGKDVG